MPADRPEPESRLPTPYWIALAALVLGFLGGLFVTVFVQLIGASFGSSTTNPTPAVNITSNYLFDAAFVAAALYFTVVQGWMGRAAFGYRRIRLRKGVGALIAAAIVYYIVTLLYAAVVHVQGTDKLPSDLGVKTSTAAAVATAVFVCVIAPMAEEFFFRGFLFGILRRMRVSLGGKQLGPWIAAVIVGIMFGLAHFDSAQPEYLIPLGFLGFVLCIVRWRTGSLYPCMALHALNNCVALGVNELGFNVLEIVGVCAGALALIALLTGPLSRGVEPVYT